MEEKVMNKELLINKFWSFHNENGRYPLKKELKYIGNWKNFLNELGVLGDGGWYKCDEQVLIDLYETSTIEDINNNLMVKRGMSTIMHKANKLNLFKVTLKTEEEYKLIIQDYLNGVDTLEISKKFGYTNSASIYYVLRKYNIKLDRYNFWSEEQIKILEEHYPLSDWEVILKLLNPFSRGAITNKAHDLSIKRIVNGEFSEEEVAIIRQYFGKISSDELQKLLPYRSKESIETKAYRLGLGTRVNWSEEEIELLKREYPYHFNAELSKMFDNRSAHGIMGMAKKLGLSKDKESHLGATYNKEMLIKDFQEYAKELGRTPIGDEVDENKNMAHSKTYERHFGSYTNACKEAGLVPCYNNSVYVTHVYYSKNNDICLSQSELIITNLYIDNDVEYEKEVFYRDLVKDDYRGFKRCDWFLLGYLVVEYFGMPERESYHKRIIEKRELCEKNGLKLLELYPPRC